MFLWGGGGGGGDLVYILFYICSQVSKKKIDRRTSRHFIYGYMALSASLNKIFLSLSLSPGYMATYILVNDHSDSERERKPASVTTLKFTHTHKRTNKPIFKNPTNPRRLINKVANVSKTDLSVNIARDQTL